MCLWMVGSGERGWGPKKAGVSRNVIAVKIVSWIVVVGLLNHSKIRVYVCVHVFHNL